MIGMPCYGYFAGNFMKKWRNTKRRQKFNLIGGMSIERTNGK